MVLLVGLTSAVAGAVDLGAVAYYALVTAVVAPAGALSVAFSEGVRLRPGDARRRR
jgi:hypothetical protein